MPASLTSDESYRAPSSLSTYHPTTVSTAESSRATSPLPIPGQKSDPHRTISPSHSRATSPLPGSKVKRRPSVTRHHTTNSSLSPPRMDGLLSRVLAEEDKYVTHLREKINELAAELRVRTDALEQAYERVRSADKRTVEMHTKFTAESNARSKADNECRKAQEETRKLQVLLEVTKRALSHAREDIERLEAEKAEAESAAGRARAVARELKQTMRVGRAREIGLAEGRAPEDRLREKEQEEAMAAAVREAYERGKTEGEASATMKALAAFDKLMENDELAGWDEDAKMNTRQEIKDMTNKQSTASAERARSPQPSPPKRKWSIRRGSNSN